ncbi:hypothetical protein J4Q44_G00368510, partial [Coregonus suidteri]
GSRQTLGVCGGKEVGRLWECVEVRKSSDWECVEVLSPGAETGPQQPSHMYRVPRSGGLICLLSCKKYFLCAKAIPWLPIHIAPDKRTFVLHNEYM